MNLWSELDNHHSIEPPKGSRPRRLTEHVVLSQMREWLLHDYVLPYCRTLAASRIYRRCYWIDGWGGDTRTFVASTENRAGPQAQPARGRKKELAPALPAVLHPIVSLSTALAQEERPIALHGILLVPERGTNGRRKAMTKEAAPVQTVPEKSGLMTGEWPQVAPVLLQGIESSPALFLLNSFNPTLFTQDALTPLYQRTTAPTELFLLIPHKQAELRLLAIARTTDGAAQLTSLLRSDRWKAFLPQDTAENKETSPFLEKFLELFMAAIHRHFLTVQRLAFPVVTSAATVEDAPYSLLFATRSKESLLRMNDAICLYRRRIEAESYRGVLNEAWFVAQQQEHLAHEQEELYRFVLQVGQGQRSRRWPDLRQLLVLAHFGEYPASEYDAVISKLLEEGLVRCQWKRSPLAREDMRVPGNEDMLLWR